MPAPRAGGPIRAAGPRPYARLLGRWALAPPAHASRHSLPETEAGIATVGRDAPRAPTLSTARFGLGIAFAVLGAALVSWIRFALGGTLNVEALQPAQDFVLGLAFAVTFAAGALLYVSALGRATGRVTPSLLAVAILVHLSAGLSLPLTSSDVFPNLAYGRLANLGKNPAIASPADLGPDDPFGRLVDAKWRGRVSVYGPILNAVASACARTGGVVSAFILFKLAMLAAALSTLWVAYGFCRTLEARGAWAFCLLGFNPLFAWEVSGQAHNDGVMLLAATAFVWAAAAEQEWLALLLLTLGFAAKFALAPLLFLYLLWILRRSPWRGAAMAVAAAGLVVGLFAPTWGGSATLAGPRLAAVPAPDHVVNSLGSLPLDLARLLFPTALEPTFLVWTVVTAAFLGVQALRFALRTTTFEGTLRDALVFTLLYECLGMLWYEPWYATWLLPLAVGCRDRRLAGIVACYSVLVPMLYHPTELYGLAALGSHGVALVLLWKVGILENETRRPHRRWASQRS
jgi:hypothetical protein